MNINSSRLILDYILSDCCENDSRYFLIKQLQDTDELHELIISEINKIDNLPFRNRLAISLMDIKNPKSVDIIINLLKNSKKNESIGTLLYALSVFKIPILHLPMLANFFLNRELEVQIESLGLIKKILTQYNKKHNVHRFIKKANKINLFTANSAKINLLHKELLLIINEICSNKKLK